MALYTKMIEEDQRDASIRAEAAQRNWLVSGQDEVQANNGEEDVAKGSTVTNVEASRRPATAPTFNARRSFSARQARPPLREYSRNTADINTQRITAAGRRPVTASPGIRFFRASGSGRLLGEGYEAGLADSVQPMAALDAETRYRIMTAAPGENAMAAACTVPRSPSPPRSCSSRQSYQPRDGQASVRTGECPRSTSSVTLTLAGYCAHYRLL